MATAVDAAGNTATVTATYTVLSAQHMNGFSAPLTNDAVNLVKGGSTVPLKFTVYGGTTPITDPADLTLSVRQVACPGAGTDTVAVAADAAGPTSLRYDSTGGQFIDSRPIPAPSDGS